MTSASASHSKSAEKVALHMGIMSRANAGSMSMARATFAYQGIKIGVIVEALEDIEWLAEFLVPWFSISDESPDISVKVCTDPKRYERQMKRGSAGGVLKAFMMDTNCIELPEWNAAVQTVAIFDEKHSVFYLVSPKHIELLRAHTRICVRMRLMRVLRELAMGTAQLSGGRFIHASAFVIDGKTAIITGPRLAGKTTLLSYMLATTGAEFLSNDRLLIKGDEVSMQAKGMPTIVSIREGTMNMIAGLRRNLEISGFSAKMTLKEARESGPLKVFPAREGRHGVSPSQFCTLLGCDPVRAAPASALIFPRQTGCTGTLMLRRLEPGQTKERLQKCLFGNIGPGHLSQTFTINPEGFHRSQVMPDDTLLERLAGSLPGFDCELGQDAFASDTGAERIKRILTKGRS